jgi:transcriptional regulator with GAF, ATPase, and Fis domain
MMHNIESLIELASILEKQNDFEHVLHLVTQKAASLIKAETALIMMINPSTRETVKTIYKEEKGIDNSRLQFIHTYFSGWVIDNKQAFLAVDIQNDSRFNKNLLKDITLKSVMCAPLFAEGMIIGSLLLINKYDGGEFSKDDFTFLKNFAIIVSPFLRNIHKIQQYFIAPISQSALLKKYEEFGLFGKSKEFIELLTTIEAAAKCDVRVLLEGESGTGKELIAKAIYLCSSRSSSKFIAVDCGAFPANLIESELFGHLKGAFTGATTSRVGLLEEANGGILFMDEISNLPLELQTKLLRVLQEGEIRPLGSNENKKVDVRIIAASSSSLRQLVNNKQFREDLYYRLYIYPIAVPSLNERKEDIPLLANYFLKKISQKQNKKAEIFSGELLDFLKLRKWKGNVRELENFIERIVTLAQPDLKILDHNILPAEHQLELHEMNIISNRKVFNKSLRDLLAEHEKEVIETVLNNCSWNQSEAARVLDISEPSIRYKINKLKIEKSKNTG